MSFDLSFETLVRYDPGNPGISLDVELRIDQTSHLVPAKLDTGSTHCIFARTHGEKLGLDIESGEELVINTVRGPFLTYGHPMTLIAVGFEFDSIVFFAANEDLSVSVLGCQGWLDRIILGINDYDGKLYLSPTIQSKNYAWIF